MIDFRGALAEVAAKLINDYDVSAFVDPRDQDLPGVWVQRQQALYETLAAETATLRIRLTMIAAAVGTWDAMGDLDSLEASCVALLPPNTGAPVFDRGDQLLPDDNTLYPARYYDVDVQVIPDPAPPDTEE